MVITTDHSAITEALQRFNIKPEDYYLMFDSGANAIYIVWCTTWNNALRLVQSEPCIDIELSDPQEWQSYEKLPATLEYLIPSPLVCVRYILAVN
jgi:hypothetical protein